MCKLNNPKDFILAGNATFTIENSKTGNRFTFKVEKPSSAHPHFVSVLTGPDNEHCFTFLGTIFQRQLYRHGRKSHISRDAQSEKAFSWIWPRILTNLIPDNVKIYHEGYCGRCGRKLTVPESIESGFGPKCITKI